mgnify:CR=1 FL=1
MRDAGSCFRQILEEYKRDLVETIIEEASKVARHRGSTEIHERDLALVLGESFHRCRWETRAWGGNVLMTIACVQLNNSG